MARTLPSSHHTSQIADGMSSSKLTYGISCRSGDGGTIHAWVAVDGWRGQRTSPYAVIAPAVALLSLSRLDRLQKKCSDEGTHSWCRRPPYRSK